MFWTFVYHICDYGGARWLEKDDGSIVAMGTKAVIVGYALFVAVDP